MVKYQDGASAGRLSLQSGFYLFQHVAHYAKKLEKNDDVGSLATISRKRVESPVVPLCCTEAGGVTCRSTLFCTEPFPNRLKGANVRKVQGILNQSRRNRGYRTI